eukprot:6647784-Prymnesium_polylepis.1
MVRLRRAGCLGVASAKGRTCKLSDRHATTTRRRRRRARRGFRLRCAPPRARIRALRSAASPSRSLVARAVVSP